MNFKENDFKFKQAQWSDAIKAFSKLNVFLDRELHVRIFLDINVNKEENLIEKGKNNTINLKEIRDFIFISESDFNYFLFLIKRLYFSIMNKHLVIDLVKYEKNDENS